MTIPSSILKFLDHGRNAFDKVLGGRERHFVHDLVSAEAARSSGKQAVMVGRSMFVTMEDGVEPAPGFVPVTPVISFGEAKKLRRFVDDSVAHLVYDIPVSFAADSYVSWGRKRKADGLLLIGGSVGDDGVKLDIFIFERGDLRQVIDRNLVSPRSEHFKEALASIVKNFRMKHHITRVCIAAPLPESFCDAVREAEYVGIEPFSFALTFPMRAHLGRGLQVHAAARENSEQRSSRRAWVVPAAIISIALCASSYLVGRAWTRYTQAVDAFVSAASLPSLKESGGIDTELLARMEAHRRMLSGRTDHREQAALLILLAKAASSIDGVYIKAIDIPTKNRAGAPAGTPGSPAAEPIATIYILMPPQDGVDPAVQGEQIAQQLAQKSGLSAQITQGGIMALDFKTQMRQWRLEISGGKSA